MLLTGSFVNQLSEYRRRIKFRCIGVACNIPPKCFQCGNAMNGDSLLLFNTFTSTSLCTCSIASSAVIIFRCSFASKWAKKVIMAKLEVIEISSVQVIDIYSVQAN